MAIGAVGPDARRADPAGVSASFESHASKLSEKAKIGLGLMAAVFNVLTLIPLAIYAAWGGFKETLHVYDPARHASIDTKLTRADLAQLKPADGEASPLAEGARRQMALQILRAAGADQEMRLIDGLSTPLLTDAASRLVEGRDRNPFSDLRQAHDGLKGQVLDPESRRLLEQWEQQPALQNAVVGEVQAAERAAVTIARPGQTPQEKEVRDFFAEVIFPSNPADADRPQGARLRELFASHPGVLLRIYQQPESLEHAGLPADVAANIAQHAEILRQGVAPEALQTEEDIQALLTRVPGAAFDHLAQAINEAFDDFSFSEVVDNSMLEGLASGTGGNFGRFMADVLRGYFDGQATIDKRAMIASFLREARAGDGNEMKLVGLLKGAGPYMQKLLQLFGDNAEGDLRAALGELKAGLSPIHPSLKKAAFAEIVHQSGGQITQIDQMRSFGAASVGETVKARVQKADGSTQEVVIKLLRPGIQQRAEREREFFERVARGIPGMTGTFQGIANQIDTEMDLSREAANVRRAQVYNAGAPNVQAMRLIDGVEPRPGYMLVEKAPGVTLQKSLATVQQMRDTPDRSRLGVHPLEAGAKLSAGLQTMASKWFTEAMYGTGFYHGDLHSGNMMFSIAPEHGSDGRLTAIDMGNAAVLSKSQRSAVFKMCLAAGVGAPEVFVRNFEKVLSPDGQRLMAQGDNRARFQEVASGILKGATVGEARRAMDLMLVQMGKMTAEQQAAKVYDDAAGREHLHPGLKIGMMLEAANLLGMEIPATIANFSRSQLMLQKAIDEVNELNAHMWEAVVDQREIADANLTARVHIVAGELAGAQKQEFEAAMAAEPRDYAVLRRFAEQPPPATQNAPIWAEIRDLAIMAATERPEPISFSDIIMDAARGHTKASVGLAFGDLTAIARRR